MKGIPKNIFHIWIGEKPVPDRWKNAIRSVREMNKAWTYQFLGSSEADRFVQERFQNLFPMYKGFPHDIQRADLLRYLLMQAYGGVYLDLKFECLKPLDDFDLQGDREVYFCKSIISRNAYTNSIIISKETASFWNALIDEIITVASKKKQHALKHMEVFHTTGPFVLNKVIKKNNRLVGSCNELLSNCSFCHPKLCKKKKYLSYDTGGDSWHAWDSKLFKTLYCYRFIIFLVVLLLVVILFFFL